MNEIQRRTEWAVAALIAIVMAACGEPASDPEVTYQAPEATQAPKIPGHSVDLPAALPAGGWTASGPGTVTVNDDGTTGAPSMSYALDGTSVWSTQTWRFNTTATAAKTVTLPFTYQGYHAWFQVQVFVRAFVTGPSGTTYYPLLAQGPVDCCTAPSGGFTLTGSTTLTVAAGDVYGFELGGSNFDSDARLQGSFTVDLGGQEVIDVTPPTIFLQADRTTLWPPNHRMLLVATVSASDDLDAAPSLSVTVTSNEPEDAKGDGATAHDWEVVNKGDGTFDVYVRAERAGGGTGRIYTLTATATDAAGNTATEAVKLVVPHDLGRP
jgi:hypothetical protein